MAVNINQTSPNNNKALPVLKAEEKYMGQNWTTDILGKGLQLKSINSAQIEDTIMKSLNDYFIAISTTRAWVPRVVGVISVLLSLVVYACLLIKISVNSKNKYLVDFSKKIVQLPMMQSVVKLLNKVPSQLLYIALWVLGITSSVLSEYISSFIFLLTGVTIVYESLTSECKRYLMLVAGIIQLAFVLVKFKPVADMIGENQFLGLFNYTSLAAVAFLVSDLVFGAKICDMKNMRPGSGKVSDLMDFNSYAKTD